MFSLWSRSDHFAELVGRVLLILFYRLNGLFLFGRWDVLIPLNAIIRRSQYITFRGAFSARRGLWLEAVCSYAGNSYCPSIEIGSNVNVGINVHIAAISSVTIGDNTLLGSRVLITDHSHGPSTPNELYGLRDIPPIKRKLHTKGEITIGKNVWIGDGAIVTAGVVIGDGAIIGGNSVVTSSVPPYSVYAGCPARSIY